MKKVSKKPAASRTISGKAVYRAQPRLRPAFFQAIESILQSARTNAYQAVNFTMVDAYWKIGQKIVEEEQLGKKRAAYGASLVQDLSMRLSQVFGNGYSPQSLWNMRQFFLAFPILSAVRRELSWTHYKALMRVESERARAWYLNEAADQNWSTRALERQINSLYYERLLMSRDKKPVRAEADEKTAALAPSPQDFIKNPYVLEFLGIPDTHRFRESDLEEAIIGKLQAFLLELGKGFAFVARQQRVSTDTKDFFIDLVFYNIVLKCFVLIDLKTAELTHQDIGQMDMDVRLYEDKYKNPGDNATVGIILCAEKDQTVVKYSVLNKNRRLFAAKYQLSLPTEQQLIEEIEREKTMIAREWGVRYGSARRNHDEPGMERLTE
jgi:predicted nuclease of restriction endonuclease-like (RecB) superfamily